MGKKIYVGNLPYSAQESDLSHYFEAAGEIVSAKIITDRDSGRSKGFGFVEFSEDDGVDKAVERFHQSEFMGRTIVVSEAREQQPRRNGGGGGGGPRRY